MRTDQLIGALAADAGPGEKPRRAIAIALLAGATAATLAFALLIGPRPDVAEASGSWRFLFKFVVCASLAGTAIVAIFRLALPEPWPARTVWALTLAPALLCAAVAAELVSTPARSWMPHLVGANALHCLALIPLLAAGPLICLIAALRLGAPARPGAAGAVAGLAASGVGAALYAANCTDDSPLFVAFWYPLATAIVVSAGALIGRQALRW